MRFYCGFSKRIPFKWILIAIGAILAFFGITNAYALEVSDLNVTASWGVFNSPGNTTRISCGVTNVQSLTQNFNTAFTNDGHEYAIIRFSEVVSGFLNQANFSFELVSDNAISSICEVKSGYLLCPMTNNAHYTGIKIYSFNSYYSCPTGYSDSTYIVSFDNILFGYKLKPDVNANNIINNNNQNTQQIIDSNKICSFYDKVSIIENGYLNSNGSFGSSSSNYGVTDYISIDNTSSIEVLNPINQSLYSCFYNINKSLISCVSLNNFSGNLVIPDGTSFFRGSINLLSNKPTFKICSNSNSVVIQQQQDINNSLNNSSVDSSSTSGGGFFDNFSVDDSRGFSSIITAPLQFLRDLLTSNSSCSPLSFGIDMKDDNITVSNTGLQLPCGNVLWSRVPQAIELIWVTLVWGLVGYRLLLDMVKFINNSLNPEYSKEYFLDL